MTNKKHSAKKRTTKKKSLENKKQKGKRKGVQSKRKKFSKGKISKKEILGSKKNLESQDKKLGSFDEEKGVSNQNLKSFFEKIFSIFKKKNFDRNFKKDELLDARKKLELELGEKLKNVRKRDYSKNPINFGDEFEDKKKQRTINKKILFSNLKKNSLGQIFSSLDFKKKKALQEKISSFNFSSYSEFEDFVVSTLSDFLMDSYEELSNKIVELIKSGGEAGKLSLESMEIPLKINLFKTTKSKEDFEKIEEMIKELNNEFLKMKKFSEEQKKKSIYSESFLSELKEEEEKLSNEKSRIKKGRLAKKKKFNKKVGSKNKFTK